MITQIKRRIIVVDDIPHWRKLLASILADYEVKVIAAYDEAIAAIDEFDFDVAILDIRLEDENVWNVDGIDLLAKIRSKKPHSSIVVLTGYRESARAQILLEHRPDLIIDKNTFDNASFREIIGRFANQNRDK